MGDAASRAQLARLRRGDPATFEEVYRAYRDRVYNFLYRLAGRRDVADDLFQETWMKLARHAPSLYDDTNLGAWLFTVARNQFRSQLRRPTAAPVELDPVELASTTASPEAESGAREELAQVERALLRLSVAERELLLLCGVEGLSAPVVAAILGVSAEAVRQRLSRARSALAATLADHARPRRRQGGAP